MGALGCVRWVPAYARTRDHPDEGPPVGEEGSPHTREQDKVNVVAVVCRRWVPACASTREGDGDGGFTNRPLQGSDGRKRRHFLTRFFDSAALRSE